MDGSVISAEVYLRHSLTSFEAQSDTKLTKCVWCCACHSES